MIFRDFVIRLLGSKARVKIVIYMMSGAGPSAEREVARRIGISHVGAGKALKELESVNFLKMVRIGNVNVWSVNEKSYAYLCAKNLEYLAQNPPLKHLTDQLRVDFGEVQRYISRVVLFGSIPEGKETELSDIDVFLQVKEAKSKQVALKHALDVSEKYRELYGNSVSPMVMAEDEAKKSKELMKNVERGIVVR